MKRIVLYFALFLMSMQPLLAQEGSLLKDINVTSTSRGLRIYESIAVGNMIYMIADDGFQKKGLWKSDGTTQGTVLVKEFTDVRDIERLTSSNGLVYLVAYAVSNHRVSYLWQSDGTAEKTVQFSNLSNEYEFQDPLLLDINNTLYFATSTGLMKTDGTAKGTVLINDNSDIKQLINANGKLFFISGDDYYYGYTLYKSDGTQAGTVAVYKSAGTWAGNGPVENNLNPTINLPVIAAGNEVYFKGYVIGKGAGLYRANNTFGVTLLRAYTGSVTNLTAVGNSLYFKAKDAANGTELWKSDGTKAGTVLVKDINPGTASSEPLLLRAVDGQLYFVADDGTHGQELWKSGGTPATTTLVKDIRPGSLGSEIKELVAVGSKAAFTANDGTGEKLWQSNGNADGTKVLADMTASQLLNVNGTLYFNGTGSAGRELFKSTMVTGGTSPVSNIARPESTPQGFTQVNGISYFTADDGIHGRELWKTDGSTAGTVLVRDVQSGANGSNPEQITNVNGTAFFVTGSDSQVHSLWKSGGTAATTIKVKDFSKTDYLQELINVNGTLFFAVSNNSGSRHLWKSDGSSVGTQLIKSFPLTDNFYPVSLNGQLYFGVYDGINNRDLWRSNGTAEGTVLVNDLANTDYKLSGFITVAGNFLYYVAKNNDQRFLVKSDGTKAGTTVIKELGFNFSSTQVTVVNELIFFITVELAAVEESLDQKLWRSDGTAQGTYSIATLRTFTGSSDNIYPGNLIAANGQFYFRPDEFEEIWKSDGTAEGTGRVTNFNPKASQIYIDNLIVLGKTLYFTASDGKSGRELWKMDLTTQTSSLAYDMTPNGSTKFYALGALNNQLLISADNGMYGAELFQYQHVAAPAVNTVRINAGGPAFTTATQKLFIADQYYAGIDRTSSVATGDILNTTDDVLYRSGRCSPSFSYNIPVANGKVIVTLHFAETYFGAPGNKGGTGSRQFNVTIENSRKLTNFDIFAAAGGAMRAVQKSIPVTVTDGMLNIDFTSGAGDLPRISAIEVVPASQTYKVVADSYVRDGNNSDTNYGNLPELDVKNVAGDDASTRRSAYIRFELPQRVIVGLAKLRIYGHNHENSKDIYLHAYGIDDDSWTENGISKNNAPAASTASLGYVAVNDQYKYYEIDVTSYVKAQQESGNDLLTLLLADPNNRNTRLVFNSKENSVNAPQLIIQPTSVSNTSARISQEEIAENAQDKQESVIYPNPAKEQFTVALSMQHAGPVSFELISQAGKSYAVRTAESAKTGEKAEVNISGLTLSTGIYMLKIQSNAFTEVIKMLVTE